LPIESQKGERVSLDSIKHVLARFGRDEEGATIVEYVLIIAMIVIAAIGAMSWLGNSASGAIYGASDNITNGN
jgi:Flp pilus assembly pilin Flp